MATSSHCPPLADTAPPEAADQTPTMTVRVANRGYTRSYEGVRITTVTIAKVCPKCGGPRGDATNHNFHEDGDWLSVDRWTNACGHVDMYDDVLIEAGIHPPRSERS